MQQYATPTTFAAGGLPSLMLVQDGGISIQAEGIRDFALRAAEAGLRQALAQTNAQLADARAREDEEAVARLEGQLAEMERGIAQVEARIAEMDVEGAVEGAAGAAAAAQGGATAVVGVPAPPPPPPIPNALPDGVVLISLAFFAAIVLLALGLPIARGFARRGTRAAVAAPDPESQRELREIRHAVEAIAIEVERISEGQRFLNRLQGTPGEAVPAEQRSAH